MVVVPDEQSYAYKSKDEFKGYDTLVAGSSRCPHGYLLTVMNNP